MRCGRPEYRHELSRHCRDCSLSRTARTSHDTVHVFTIRVRLGARVHGPTDQRQQYVGQLQYMVDGGATLVLVPPARWRHYIV